jgi:hypothetical protein
MQGADALITELLDSSQCFLKRSIKAVLHRSDSSAITKIGPAPSTVMQYATHNEDRNKIS